MRKRVLALALTLLLSVPVSAAWSGLPRTGAAYAGQLSDVTKDSPFYENIAALWEYGLTVGKADGSFGVKDNLTVGQTVIFAGRLRSLSQTGDPEKGPAAYRKDGQAAYEPYLLYLQGLKALRDELSGTYAQAATRARRGPHPGLRPAGGGPGPHPTAPWWPSATPRAASSRT